MRYFSAIALLLCSGCTSLNSIPGLRRIVPGVNPPMTDAQIEYASFAPWQYGAVACFIAALVFILLERKLSFTSGVLVIGAIAMGVTAHIIPKYGGWIFILLCLLCIVAGGYWIYTMTEGKRQVKIAGITFHKDEDMIS